MYFPFFIDIKGKKCIIAGGGKVAFRKASILASFGAEVHVISPEIIPEFIALKDNQMNEIILEKKCFEIKDINEAFVVIAATDDNVVNSDIGNICTSRNILVNVATDPDISTFIFPSVITRGETVVGISSGGNSPVLARKLREDIDGVLPSFLDRAANQLGQVRDLVKNSVCNEKLRRDIFREILDQIYVHGRELTDDELYAIIDSKK